MDTAFLVAVRNALTSFVGRVVLALFTFVVFPVLPSVVNFVNEVLGYDLTDAEVRDYAKNIAYAVGGLAAVWLLNNGLFERAALNAKKLIEGGADARVEIEETDRKK